MTTLEELLRLHAALTTPGGRDFRFMPRDRDTAWVAGSPPPEQTQHSAKTRYRQADAPCVLTTVRDSEIRVDFARPQCAVTPGQSVVLYDSEVCLGGGVIT